MIESANGQNTDIDVEALLTQVRQRVEERRAPEPERPTAHAASADSSGESGGDPAADFQRSVVRAVSVLAQHLQTTRARLGATDVWLRSETESNAFVNQQTAQQIELLSALVETLARRVDGLVVTIPALEHRLADTAADLRRDVRSGLDALDREIGVQEERHTQTTLRTGELESRLVAAIEGLEQRIDGLATRLDEVEQQVRSSRDAEATRALDTERVPAPHQHALEPAAGHVQPAGGRPASADDGLVVPATGPAGTAANDEAFDYFRFEAQFRGTVADIKLRQTKYLELFLGRERVLDLGSGRGEFVELLMEHGIDVTGVDLNPDMVEFCRKRDLPVVRADLFEYLDRLPDASVDGIFAAQVVEHLGPNQLPRLIRYCAEKLRTGGVAVIETLNANCSAALHWFYLDPTHVRPVLPELLRFVFEQGPFEVRSVRFSGPVPGSDVADVLEVTSGWPPEIRHYQDYAVVAIRR